MYPECKILIPNEAIILATKKKWLVDVYYAHRATLLMKIEATKFQETQAATTSYLAALTIRGQSSYQPTEPRILDSALICIEKYGQGFEDFDFFDVDNAKARPRGINIGCPAPNCLGFISHTHVCVLCSCEICPDCHEICKSSSQHRCDPGTVASIKAVFQEAKPCPKCSALISKTEGCDQMFCTQCNTTYSWLTNDLIKGPVHNPHYFQWLFSLRNGNGPATIERLMPQAEAACEQYISFQNLARCFSPQTIAAATALRGCLPAVHDLLAPLPSHAHYYLALNHLRDGILHVRATSGNHANIQPTDNHDLRVRLQVNEITLDEMKAQVIERDTEYRRYMAYCSVYLTVYESSIIMFDNLFAFTCERFKLSRQVAKQQFPVDQFLHETYLQLQHLLTLANECLDFKSKVYGEDPMFVRFQRHPYS